jgi:hypothetical protein
MEELKSLTINIQEGITVGGCNRGSEGSSKLGKTVDQI